MSAPIKGVLARMHAAIITEDQPIPITCAMLYAENSPFEVVFMAEERTEDGDPVEWRYARDLIVDALRVGETMHGGGDVEVFKENGFVYTILKQGNRQVIVAFMQQDMERFIFETEKVCPVGQESMDLDEELRSFLAEE